MSILLLNASPKRITSASQYFLDLLHIQLIGNKTSMLKLSGPKVYTEVFSRFTDIDALVIAMPVYVDGVPSHVLRFLEEAEQFLKENKCNFKMYVISNCGFYEGRQCRHLLNIMHTFCKTAGVTWGGGLGIGAGEMLSVLRLTPFIFTFLSLFIAVPIILFTEGSFLGIGISTGVSLTVFFILNLRLFYSINKLQKAIRHGKIISNFYTGLTLCPRFIFIIFAHMYMIVRAMFNGVGFWEMYKKTKYFEINSSK